MDNQKPILIKFRGVWSKPEINHAVVGMEYTSSFIILILVRW